MESDVKALLDALQTALLVMGQEIKDIKHNHYCFEKDLRKIKARLTEIERI